MKKPKFIPEFDDIPTPRTKMPELEIAERDLSFSEVELGFTEELALGEAVRCLSCRRCIGCGLCLAECDRDAIVYDQESEATQVSVDEVVLATGSAPFEASRKPELGYESGMNIVTTAELERILSPTGPYAGLPLRPGDGLFPRRVAFVQCVGSREEGIGADYCSSTCCTDALELASRLRERLGDVELTIYHRGMRPLGRRGEELFREAEAGGGPALVMAMVTGVAGPDCEGPVTVTYDTGSGDTEEEFDLVVLSVGRVSGHTRSAARRFRSDTNKFGFVSVGPLAPVASSAEHVLVAGASSGPSDLLGAADAGAAAAAVSSRAEDYLETGADGSSSPVEVEPAHDREVRGDAPAVVCVCEHGMRATGLTPGELVREVGRLEDVRLAVSLTLACGHESLDRLRDLASGLAGARVLIVGCFPRTHAGLVTERVAAGLPSAGAVELVGVDPGSSVSETSGRVRDMLAQGPQAGGRSSGRPPARRVLVAGGGLAGLTAALEVSAHGVPVTLVERSTELGGAAPIRIASDPALVDQWASLAERISSDPLVDVRLGTAISSLESAEGGFRPILDGDGSAPAEAHGAIIVATGADDHRPPTTPGRDGGVITQARFPETIGAGGALGKVVMVQCVGSRSAEHPRCSRTCCGDALRNALRLRRESPDSEITILHRGIRVWGFDEELLSEAIDAGVEFIEVTATADVGGNGKLVVSATGVDGEPVSLEPDTVVLSTGVEPASATADVATALGADLPDDGFFPASGRVIGARPGLYAHACGRSAGPADIEERITQAQAAAGRVCLFLKRGCNEAQ